MESISTRTHSNPEFLEEEERKRDSESKQHERVLIKIIVINDIPYIWDADEYMILRNEHRILGTLDGASLKHFKGTQYFANSSALPIRLSRFEAYFMVKHGIALAFRIPALNQIEPQVAPEQVERLKEDRRNEELELFRSKRRLQIESMVDKIIEGKRRKGRGLVPDRNTVIQEEMQKVELPFHITQIDIIDPWIKDSDFISCDVALASNSLLDRLRYKVFEDFNLRKYYISTGLKFGGDFLAYPGDPMNFHSQFLIVCHDHKARGPSPPYIHKQVRLANIVRKILLVAFLEEENDRVRYVTMNALKTKGDSLENKNLSLEEADSKGEMNNCNEETK